MLHLTLNRPDSRNALSIAMVAELRAALAAAEAAGDVRVIVLRGAGGHFCSGGDLKDMAAGAGDAAALRRLSAAFGEFCGAFADTGIATVAVLEGTVMGGGFGLACVADVALAADTVSFRLPETSLGVVPAQIAPFLVQRLGYSQARRLAVSGGRLDGRQALSLGLVHELHAAADLDAALARVLGEILQCAPRAVAATKRLMAKALHREASEMVPEAAELFAEAVLGEEGLEGVNAFVQKRRPRWVPTT
ncbi:enoyl-CoA hydratase/isomerase family protein [Roseateles violae]|uniref:Enoyl-CoA hydratase-related protein n=1 Tax=Roseateles violae TaxID=3058042 RepID=A0ABT8DSX7_9BURK|nr:enoyl-CoA hydratase-related protein [Pelomonas sp. PFR6]MDN3921203.1 enoyl-CoA hydratase-related protein [Pelomonas sp. PFR6]